MLPAPSEIDPTVHSKVGVRTPSSGSVAVAAQVRMLPVTTPMLGEILTVFYALTGVGCARAKGWGMVAYFSSSMLTLGLFSALYLGG